MIAETGKLSNTTPGQSAGNLAVPPQSRRELGASSMAAASSSAAGAAAVTGLLMQQQQAQGTAVAEPRSKTVLEHASSRDTEPNVARHDYANAGQTSIYFGNWGIRSMHPKTSAQRGVHDNNVAQILKNPCHILTLAEANAATSADLEMGHKPQSRRNTGHPFDDRTVPEDRYYVFRGDDENDVLIACRRSVASDLLLLQHDCNLSTEIKDHKKWKEVKTRVMMCEIHFKQSVQCIGKSLGVAVVHLHYAIAKMTNNERIYARFWDNLAADLKKNNITFMSGDFNMSLTRVLPELRSRGVLADLCAWYPYIANNAADDQKFHLDSCGIFVIGGNTAVQMQWDDTQMHIFASQNSTQLPIYNGASPGQSWKCYRPLNLSIPNLLGPLLDRSFTAPNTATTNRTHLRVKQKELTREIWEINGAMHRGAHFPLSVWTVGNSFRSAAGHSRRQKKSSDRRNRDGEAEGSAVAEPGSAVAEPDAAPEENAAPISAVADTIAAGASAVADASASDGGSYSENMSSSVLVYPALHGMQERYNVHRYA